MTVRIARMAGFATVQDLGRPGYRAAGVPRGGAMDARSLARANALAGNQVGAAAIEWALSGGAISCRARTIFAVAGADVELSRAGKPVSSETPFELAAGEELSIGRFVRGAFLYVAVRGGIAVPLVLSSRATYLPGEFGGLGGRRLRAGDVLPIGNAFSAAEKSPVASPAGVLRGSTIRVVEGPDAAAFPAAFRSAFWRSRFGISRSSDRTGYRLEGAPPSNASRRVALSEPACVGAIQLPGAAEAIVLMADGPTVGGYPRIGVVAAVDLPTLAQKTPGEHVELELITLDEARSLFRADRSLAALSAS